MKSLTEVNVSRRMAWRSGRSTRWRCPARRPAAGSTSASLEGREHYRDLVDLRRAARLRPSRPPIPSAAYRVFHAITVGFDTPVRLTISFVPTPSAASSTIRARCASPAGIDRARSHRPSSERSDSGNTTTAFNGIARSIVKLSYFVHMTLASAHCGLEADRRADH